MENLKGVLIGDLVKATHNKFVSKALRSSIRSIYGCKNPNISHDHGVCIFSINKNDIMIYEGSIGIIVDSIQCDSSLLSKNNNKSLKENEIIIWFKCIFYDMLEKKIKIIWVKENDVITIQKQKNYLLFNSI